MIRAAQDPEALISAVRETVVRLDPDLPLCNVGTMERAIARSLVTIRLTNLLLDGFAATALLVALVGTCAVISLDIGRRTTEFGIRLALGARPADVRRSIVLRGTRLAFVGIALGAGVAYGVTSLLEGLLFGVAACYLLARRATRLDPMIAIRQT